MSNGINHILKKLGPGILFAGAAIGVSHLIQSTRAGAQYGYSLILIIFLVNLFKYPFFEIGQRYTSAMNESLIRGYKRLGDWAVWIYFSLSLISAILTTAVVTFVASALCKILINKYIDFSFAVDDITIGFLIVIAIILYIGRYSALEKMVKYLVIGLSIFTIVAVILAFSNGNNIQPGFIEPDLFDVAGISFLLALMGWMPAPIELSTWSSLWTLEKEKEQGKRVSFSDALFDFNVGYILTAVLAVSFLLLGYLLCMVRAKNFHLKLPYLLIN